MNVITMNHNELCGMCENAQTDRYDDNYRMPVCAACADDAANDAVTEATRREREIIMPNRITVGTLVKTTWQFGTPVTGTVTRIAGEYAEVTLDSARPGIIKLMSELKAVGSAY